MLEYRLTSVSAFAVTAAMTLASSATMAQPVELGDAELRQLLPGAVIELDTPVGVRLPITFTGDGLMTGEAGRLEPYLGAPRDRGRWWVNDGKLCQKWFRWLDAKPRCARVTRAGNRILWQEDGGEKGTATIVAEARREPDPPAAQPHPRPMAAGLLAAAPERPAVKAAPVMPRPAVDAGRATPATTAPANPKAATVAAQVAPPMPVAPHFATPALAAVVKRDDASPASPAVRQAARPTVAPAGPAARRVAQPARPFNPPIPLPTRRVAEVAEAPPATFTRALTTNGGTFRVRGVTSDDVLNVRGGPSDSHPIVGGLQPGSGRIRIVGRCVEEWCEVSAPRVAGWVNVLFLAPERAAPRYRFDPFRQGLGGPFVPGS